MKKIDIHVHCIKSKFGLQEGFDRGNFPTPAELREMYDQIGVERGVISPLLKIECSYDTSSNREVKEIVDEHGDWLSWFCAIDPRQGSNSPDTDFSKFIDFYKSQGAKGIGEILANLYFDDPRVLNLFHHCEKCDMPVIFHIGNNGGDYGLIDDFGLPRLEKVLQMFPKLQFLGHSQKFWSSISGDVTPGVWNGYPTGKVAPGGRVVELMRKYPNLCADLSAGSGYNAMARDPEFAYGFIEEFQDRVFYGTDICAPWNITLPMIKLSAFLDEAVAQGKISQAAYEKVSRLNALKILQK